jgi:hypothetical protein
MILSQLKIVNNTVGGGGLSWVRLRYEFESPLVRRTERDFSPGAATPDADTHSQVPTSHVSLYGLRPASITSITQNEF